MAYQLETDFSKQFITSVFYFWSQNFCGVSDYIMAASYLMGSLVLTSNTNMKVVEGVIWANAILYNLFMVVSLIV